MKLCQLLRCFLTHLLGFPWSMTIKMVQAALIKRATLTLSSLPLNLPNKTSITQRLKHCTAQSYNYQWRDDHYILWETRGPYSKHTHFTPLQIPHTKLCDTIIFGVSGKIEDHQRCSLSTGRIPDRFCLRELAIQLKEEEKKPTSVLKWIQVRALRPRISSRSFAKREQTYYQMQSNAKSPRLGESASICQSSSFTFPQNLKCKLTPNNLSVPIKNEFILKRQKQFLYARISMCTLINIKIKHCTHAPLN